MHSVDHVHGQEAFCWALLTPDPASFSVLSISVLLSFTHKCTEDIGVLSMEEMCSEWCFLRLDAF